MDTLDSRMGKYRLDYLVRVRTMGRIRYDITQRCQIQLQARLWKALTPIAWNFKVEYLDEHA